MVVSIAQGEILLIAVDSRKKIKKLLLFKGS